MNTSSKLEIHANMLNRCLTSILLSSRITRVFLSQINPSVTGLGTFITFQKLDDFAGKEVEL